MTNFRTLTLLAALLLAACQGDLNIKPVAAPSNGAAKIPGKFAAYIGGGGWTLTGGGALCSYTIHLDAALVEAMHQTLADTVETVTFFPVAPSYAQLAQQGYDGEIVLKQGLDAGNFTTHGSHVSATVQLEARLTTTDAKGTRDANLVSFGNGSSGNYIQCAAIGTAITDAAQKSVANLMTRVKGTVRTEFAPAPNRLSHAN